MNITWNSIISVLFAVSGGLCLSGCSSTSVFRDYPSQLNPVIASVQQNAPPKTPIFVKEVQSKDKTLYLLERGRVAQLFGNTEASKGDYTSAIDAVRENDEKAKVSASDAAAQAAAVLLNDNALPYRAAGYERVMLRTLQTLNYLASGDVDAARVEIANADAEQKDAAEKHAKEVEKAERKAAEQRDKKDNPATVDAGEKPNDANENASTNDHAKAATSKSVFGGLGGSLGSLKKPGGASPLNSSSPTKSASAGLPDFGQTYDFIKSNLGEKYAGLDEVVGKVKNSFQNGAAYYLSGLIYEALKDSNNAYISYKQALELNPENKFLQKDVVRIAAQDGRAEDLADLKTRFGLTDEEIKKNTITGGNGRVVILYEDGFVAQKQEIKIPIPVLGSEAVREGSKSINLQGAVFIAFPIYSAKAEPLLPLTIGVGEATDATMPLCSINALATKHLKENAMIMATRQVVRFVAKAAVVKVANDKAGALGGLIASVAAGATENADLRSWLTLPKDIQLCQLTLAAGEHELALTAGSDAGSRAKIKVQAGKTTLVRVVRAGTNMAVTSSIF